MSALEVNKILASIIIAILVVVIISHLGDILIDVDNDNLTETAYKIEIEENQEILGATLNNDINIEPISSLLLSASSAKGQKIYKKCGTCHTYEKNGVDKVGPNLWNIINRPKADIDGYNYSKALAEFGGVWNYEELAAFLYKPKDFMEGTKMNFAGLKKVQDRADLVLFLREQSDNPAELP